MKRLVTSIICALFLLIATKQANASYFSDWEYGVSITSLVKDNKSYDSLSWTSGNYQSTISIYPNGTAQTFDNILELSSTFYANSPNHADSAIAESTNFLGQTTTLSTEANYDTSPYFIGDLTIALKATNNNASLQTTYTIPLWSYYDLGTDKSYVFFDYLSVSLRGSTSTTVDNVTYTVGGVNLIFNGTDLELITEFEQGLYSGWETSVSQETPAPTPEPATMLLTGLGLAGLGYMKRRRK